VLSNNVNDWQLGTIYTVCGLTIKTYLQFFCSKSLSAQKACLPTACPAQT